MRVVEFTFEARCTDQIVYMYAGRRAARQFIDLAAAYFRNRGRQSWLCQHSTENLGLINPTNLSEVHTIRVLFYRQNDAQLSTTYASDNDVEMTDMEDGLEALTLQT